MAAVIALAGVLISALVSWMVSLGQVKKNARVTRIAHELSLILQDINTIRQAKWKYHDFVNEHEGSEINPLDMDNARDRLNGVIFECLHKREYMLSENEFKNVRDLGDLPHGHAHETNFADRILSVLLGMVRKMRSQLGINTKWPKKLFSNEKPVLDEW